MVFTSRVSTILLDDPVFLGLSPVYHLAKLLLDFLLLFSLSYQLNSQPGQKNLKG